ncbi:NUDIX hydrolase [Nocardioides sp. GY 10127]|uniref:NUDIX hydrolase n=1 Tax=Nocardioides sp. GY 10127 TaxID=2569762 RepID=UPI0010A8C2C0|nr:NUDIX hydrolase [Nocardioides sp. GY 10127]TIC79420.1 NUDIX domain-containing protein [Nocardioides sp. GY 10127]
MERRQPRPTTRDAGDGSSREVLAAGGVVFRKGGEVLLVHRPKYDDWSFPKGKVDPGEHPLVTAVREVEEEAGVRVRLGDRLPDQLYPVAAGTKRVHYWQARVLGDDDVRGYRRGNEIDEVRWVHRSEAPALLTHERDRALLRDAVPGRKRTTPLVVLRHAAARPRVEWDGEDRLRPLHVTGSAQADALVPVLGTWDVQRVVTSSSTRCVRTVEPYAAARSLRPEAVAGLSEEGSTRDDVQRLVARAAREAVADRRPTLLCSHRPVLPWVLEGLGLRQVVLAPGELVVAHLRATDGPAEALEPGGPVPPEGVRVVGVEVHRVD